MKLIIQDNLTSAQWDEFIKANAGDGGWLQTWNWGDFQMSNNRKIRRLAVMADQKILLQALAVKHRLPFKKNYFYLPRGPVLALGLADQSITETLGFFWTELSKLARQERAIFLRVDPPWTESEKLIAGGFEFSGVVQPRQTLILDLRPSEVELLKNMKAKTRYNIKIAEKRGVKIRYARGEGNGQDFEIFWQLMIQTARRDRITTHSRDYYRRMLKTLGISLALAEIKGQVLAGAIVADFGDWRTYLHGASNYEFREKMAPYGLQWQLIKDAKNSGCRFYDFWGADEKIWPGVTRFKVGFAPTAELTRYIGAYDRPISKLWHYFYKALKKIKS